MLELWGGVECTVNRVRDEYFDQMRRNGHHDRADDIERFAELGIHAIRYPVLWEQVAPTESGELDWSWPDERMSRLRAAGLRPIVGLTHHGSGPRHTSLVDPGYPRKLARFARSVAERYPWVMDFTPVNEPLTTARFSGLYGFWYPHGRSGPTFARALVNQCRATALAMRAVREVIPGARLVQTEDLGRIFSTLRLAPIAAFQNERRWLSFDLLCGRVDRHHRFWPILRSWRIPEAELEAMVEQPCPPDIMGINHYLTSDRFLDDDLTHYPESRHWKGGADVDQHYADVEAVRSCIECPVTTCTVLREAYNRYRIPLAVTEAHLAATREDQIRWLYEVWHGASRLRRSGIDVRAVTAWSLLGAFDWNVLVTSCNGFYEPGVFDIRAPEPRPTALARVVRNLATAGHADDEPLLGQPGWWHRPDRLFHAASSHGRSVEEPSSEPVLDMKDRSLRPLLVLGATGTLGRAFARLCDARGIPYHLLGRRQLDLTDPSSFDTALDETNPWAVVNAAGYVRVDDAEREPDACAAVNVKGPAMLAEACARQGIPLLSFSSDLVFDGARAEGPYIEDSAVAPLNVYGRTKAEMEARIFEVHPAALVIRTSAFFGPWDEANFVTQTLRALAMGETVEAASDAIVSPTYVPDLVHAALDLLIDEEQGLWHLASQGAVTWAELARTAARLADIRTGRVEGRATADLGLAAPRPLYSALASRRGWIMPTLEDALERFLRDRDVPDALRAAA
jgi:dTDP-4-dehydrorhamnose reductase